MNKQNNHNKGILKKHIFNFNYKINSNSCERLNHKFYIKLQDNFPTNLQYIYKLKNKIISTSKN